MTVSNVFYVVMPIVMVAAMGLWLGLIFRADGQAVKRASRSAATRQPVRPQPPAVAAEADSHEPGSHEVSAADLTFSGARAEAEHTHDHKREPVPH